MTEDKSLKRWFGVNLAELLSEKIMEISPEFDQLAYLELIERECPDLGYSKRIELHADALHESLPQPYSTQVDILIRILGEENPNETGMFTGYYWVMPIGKFIEKYGLDDYEISIHAIEEITKRNTGEYAIRPFIRMYPEQTIKIMEEWSNSENFHLRRLASEGLRPKLPWSTKLDTFIENPEPVFFILENLMEDEIKFVQKSVANHLTDYLKVNYPAAVQFIRKWRTSENKHTQWILKHATRKISVD